MAYATIAEYEAWSGEAAPAGINRALELASLAVDDAMSRPFLQYSESQDEWTAPATLPEYVLDALRLATCAQAENVLASGELDSIDSVSIGSLSITKSASSDSLTTYAMAYLRRAGLLYRGIASGTPVANPFYGPIR